jgi:hypothetical protein
MLSNETLGNFEFKMWNKYLHWLTFTFLEWGLFVAIFNLGIFLILNCETPFVPLA